MDTSWNWDYFKPAPEAGLAGEWGGYDSNYDAFERYVPGSDAPWGSSKYSGNMDDFYQQQLANALRQEQGYNNRAREAERIRMEALQNPQEAPPVDWSWAFGGKGLPDVQLGTGVPYGSEAEWLINPNYDLKKGMTNREVISALGPIWSEQENQRWQNWMAEDQPCLV